MCTSPRQLVHCTTGGDSAAATSDSAAATNEARKFAGIHPLVCP